jgi:DNA polymerase-3 subunit alpha
LKANHPVEFLAASMTLDLGNTDKLMQFRQESQRLGVRIVPPSVNHSNVDFAVKEGAILYALAALKNVGAGAMRELVREREERGPFRSLGEFARRVDARMINKRALESLVKAGAFDQLNPNRAQVLDAVETILSLSSRAASQAEAGQNDLFGGGQAAADDLVLPRRDSWLPMERLAQEFEAVGFYLSGHPLDDYMKPLSKLGVESWATFRAKALSKGATAAKLAGTVTHRQERRSKSGNKFAFVGFSDPSGQFEAICFSDTLALTRDLLEPGKSVLARVEAEVEGEEVKLRLQGVEVLDKAAANATSGLLIFVRDSRPIDSIAQRLVNGGKAPVKLVFILDKGREVEVALGNKFTVTPQIKSAIKAIDGVLEVNDL